MRRGQLAGWHQQLQHIWHLLSLQVVLQACKRGLRCIIAEGHQQLQHGWHNMTMQVTWEACQHG